MIGVTTCRSQNGKSCIAIGGYAVCPLRVRLSGPRSPLGFVNTASVTWNWCFVSAGRFGFAIVRMCWKSAGAGSGLVVGLPVVLVGVGVGVGLGGVGGIWVGVA